MVCCARMANKTQPTKDSAVKFLAAIKDQKTRKASQALFKLIGSATKQKPILWSNGMIGFGVYHYKSDRSAQEGDWPMAAFAPRKGNVTFYLMSGVRNHAKLVKQLGVKTSGGSCIYIKDLSKLDQKALQQLIKESYSRMKKKYPLVK